MSINISRLRWCTPGPLQRIVSSCVLRLTRVGVCWTVQFFRMSSFGSRRPRCSGSNSMRHRSRAPGRAGDSATAWWLWGATCTCLEGKMPLQVIQDACDAGNRLVVCQIERRRCSSRCGACWYMLCSSGMSCCSAASKSGDSGRHITPLLAP
jgi:hypothetical protein